MDPVIGHQPDRSQHLMNRSDNNHSDDGVEQPPKKFARVISNEELLMRTLPEYLQSGLDVIFVGFNPGLVAAETQRWYAGPGNHFWKCLSLSGLVPEDMTSFDDQRLLEYGIGLTNLVERTTRGSGDLNTTEMRSGAAILLEKIRKYLPKIVAFNGKEIYRMFSGKKDFPLGKQPEPVDGTNVHMYVMPSTSARCAQLPRVEDKLQYFHGLKLLREFACGRIDHLDPALVIFPSMLASPTKLAAVKCSSPPASPPASPLDDKLMVNNIIADETTVHGDDHLIDNLPSSVLHVSAAEVDRLLMAPSEFIGNNSGALDQSIIDAHIRESVAAVVQRCKDGTQHFPEHYIRPSTPPSKPPPAHHHQQHHHQQQQVAPQSRPPPQQHRRNHATAIDTNMYAAACNHQTNTTAPLDAFALGNYLQCQQNSAYASAVPNVVSHPTAAYQAVQWPANLYNAFTANPYAQQQQQQQDHHNMQQQQHQQANTTQQQFYSYLGNYGQQGGGGPPNNSQF